MAGPTIVVRVLGDLKSLGKSFDDAKSKGAGAAKSMHDAFSGMLGVLNKTGVLGPFGEALDGIDAALDSVSGHAKDIGPSMIGIGGALAGVGVGLSALGSKDKAAHQQLQASVEATGKSYDDYEGKIEAAIKHQEKFGDSANETQDALRILTTATNDPAKALGLLNEATDLAAAKHEDLSTAATSLGKVYNGNTKLLKEFGISVTNAGSATKAVTSATHAAQSADDNLAHAKRTLADIEEVDAGKKKLTVGQAIQLRNAQEAVTTASAKATEAHKKLNDAQDAAKKASQNQGGAVVELAGKLHGQGSAAADTFSGHVAAIKAHFEDVAASIGTKYGPAITGAGTVMAGLGGAITTTQGIMSTFTKASKDTETAVKGVEGAEEGAQAASSLLAGASGIGLVLLAVAALVAIGYVLYKNWDTIWGGIKRIVADVWNWIKANWPLLLGILLGPIALAAALIYKYWGQISAGFKAALAAIKAAWAVFVGWLSGLAGSIARIAAGMWHGVSDAFGTALGAIQTAWGTFWGWFTGLPGGIARAASGMWHGITDAFHGAINAAIDIWNRLHFKLPAINWGPIHLGGSTIGVPYIPHLAQGGLVTQTGLIYAHAGEAITPMPGRLGPAVSIQNAHFNSGLDVETFMRKAAWIVQTRRI